MEIIGVPIWQIALFAIVMIVLLITLFKSLVNVKGDEIAVLERRWFGKEMAEGRTVALKGEVGVQAKIMGPGLSFVTPYIYKVKKNKYIQVGTKEVGLITARTGKPIPQNRFFAQEVECNLFQDGEAFLKMGGEKGPQLTILPPGEYRINPHLFEVIVKEATIIQDNQVGLVEAIAGLPVAAGRIFANAVESNKFQDASLFLKNEGQRGPQPDVIPPGFYRINTLMFNVRIVSATVIPGGKIGLVTAMDGVQVPSGRLLGKSIWGHCNFEKGETFIKEGGEKGRQLDFLMPGTYRINTNLFKIDSNTNLVEIGSEEIGIVTILEGKPIMDKEQIAATEIDLKKHSNFQDASAFIDAGGEKGLQINSLRSGNYAINSYFASVEKVQMVAVPIGHVGVVISYVGDEGVDTSGQEFKHGNIVQRGQKGVWKDILHPGKYPINTSVMKVEIVPTTNIVLNWADARTESHNLDDKLSTITVRSKDGFQFNLDVSQIIHVPADEAPKVIARFGSMKNLVSQVLEPTIGNYFRNSAQNSDAIDFLVHRSERQKESKEHIKEVLDEYNVDAVDTLIGDINPPESLMKTLTERKLAQEMKQTYEMQRESQDTRKALESSTADANMQAEIIQSERKILIAENDAKASIKKSEGQKSSAILEAEGAAESTKIQANAEAERINKTGSAEAEITSKKGTAEANVIEAKGLATAKGYEAQVAAIGQGNFTSLEIAKEFAAGKLKIVPDNLIISGGGEGGNSNLENMVGLAIFDRFAAKGKDEEDASKKTKKKE